jgi:D-alanyl-D-alanine carboxypeptidase/D-alanyl-D-alanine-endopeptidase (penicillin-binding protein 4)
MIRRRAVLTAGLTAGMSALAGAAFGQTRPLARPDRTAQSGGAAALCAQAIAAAKLGGKVGYAVADLSTGQVLDAFDADTPLPPASVSKAVTTLYALQHLGAGHRFETQLLATGPLQGGVLQGDLILAGGGDPNFDTDRMGDLAAALARTSLRRITGRFLVWDGALPHIDRITDDQPDFVGYNPTISGVMLNYNRAQFVWGGGNLSVNAEGSRFVPAVQVVQVKTAPREAPLFVYESKTPIERWSVAAPALNKAGSRWLPVRVPSAYAGDVFGALCGAQGIKLPKAAETQALPNGAQMLAQDRSEKLDQLMRDMLRYSTNLTAEAIGLTTSRAATIAASGAAMSDWAQARFGISAQFFDHSGLGAASLCTPADMLRVMLGAKDTALISLLRERGVDSTGREDKNGALRVFAKSGTLNFTSNLAGYVTAPSGRALAFAVFAADSPRRAALPQDQREDPIGGAAWTKRARTMHRAMIAAWSGEWL